MPGMISFIERLRSKQPAQKRNHAAPSEWTARDWADLPVHHPRDAR